MSEADYLVVDRVGARYADTIVALQDVSLRLRRGGILALAGANGAGKTTLLRAISNLLPVERGRVLAGSIRFDGRDVLRSDPGDLVRHGLVPVLEGRRCFKSLTLEENLMTGGIATGSNRAALRRNLDRVYTIFPGVAAKRRLIAGHVSGGEQQMTAIGRALMARPHLLVLDEPSMGLAPLVVRDIFDALVRLNRDENLTILFAEQNLSLAKRYAHDIVILNNGVTMPATAGAVEQLDRLYFGDLENA